MKTECNQQTLLFPELISRAVSVDFKGGYVSSDGGGVLLARLDRSHGYLARFARHFVDHRKEELIEHSVLELLRQRVYGIALGYEDLNDHDLLRLDPLLAALCGKEDVLGEKRRKEADRGKALAGKSTLNRLELTRADASGAERYKKIVAREQEIEDYFIREWVRSLSKDTKEVILDLDATDDPLHGQQEGRFFHGYYGEYCYLPLYIFCGSWPLVAKLRDSKRDASSGALEEVEKIVAVLREKFPDMRVILRADSGFCRDGLLHWCERNKVFYIVGIARNPVLERQTAAAMEEARTLSEADEAKPARVFVEFDYAAGSWETRRRRVIGKAEWTRGEANPRFILTNFPVQEYEGRVLYEQVYCGRGEMENRIKEQQLDLYADRTSTHWMRANQLRLWFSTLAYLLVNQLRQVALAGTELARATCGTIRLRLFKIGALVKISVRRVSVSLSSACPLAGLFSQVAARLMPQASAG